jgi:hypothetical protein
MKKTLDYGNSDLPFASSWMKKSSLLALLAGLQVLAAVVLAGLCALNVYFTHKINLQARMFGGLTQNQRALEQLASSTLEYARTHPAFDADLVRAGFKPATVNSPKANR